MCCYQQLHANLSRVKTQPLCSFLIVCLATMHLQIEYKCFKIFLNYLCSVFFKHFKKELCLNFLTNLTDLDGLTLIDFDWKMQSSKLARNEASAPSCLEIITSSYCVNIDDFTSEIEIRDYFAF